FTIRIGELFKYINISKVLFKILLIIQFKDGIYLYFLNIGSLDDSFILYLKAKLIYVIFDVCPILEGQVKKDIISHAVDIVQSSFHAVTFRYYAVPVWFPLKELIGIVL